jgi:hypothetical protein
MPGWTRWPLEVLNLGPPKTQAACDTQVYLQITQTKKLSLFSVPLNPLGTSKNKVSS